MKLTFAMLLLTAPAFADEPAWYAKAVESVEAKFEPAEAKPGATVKYTLAVTLRPGYHTYPLKQADKAAAEMVNKLEFPAPAALVFVGETADPPMPTVKAEPELGIQKLHVYTGRVVYERWAVVSPKAATGAAGAKAPFRLSVCDKDNCFPSLKLTPEAALKVLDGPAVAVEAKYAAEVEKALKGN